MFRHLLILLALGLFSTRHASGSFTVFVGDGSPFVFDVSAGTGTMPVFAYNADTVNAVIISSYDLAFDIASGNANFTGFSADFTGGIFPGGSSDLSSPPIPGLSFIASNAAASGSVTLPTTQASALKLFDLTFSISPTTPTGTYAFTFLPNLIFGGEPVSVINGPGAGNDNPLAVFSGTNYNQFEITSNAVPEPTSLLLVACAGGVAAFRLKRRRKLNADSLSPVTAA